MLMLFCACWKYKLLFAYHINLVRSNMSVLCFQPYSTSPMWKSFNPMGLTYDKVNKADNLNNRWSHTVVTYSAITLWHIDPVDLKSDLCQCHWFSCLRKSIILPLFFFSLHSYLYVMAIIFIFVLSFPAGFKMEHGQSDQEDDVWKCLLTTWRIHTKADPGQLNIRCTDRDHFMEAQWACCYCTCHF